MRRRYGVFITITVILVMTVLLSGVIFAAVTSSNTEDPPEKPGGAGSVEGSVEILEGRKYHCFRYTTVSRGGLWCTQVGAENP